MKIVLSRKGFDSGYGGYPSLIMPTGEMITLPIPSSEDNVYYNDLKTKSGEKIIDLMLSLNQNIKTENKNIPLTKKTTCHLDPDLIQESVPRLDGWRGCFGQISAAQKVLENNQIKEGDLFIFFGWFNEIEKTPTGYKFKKGDGKHTIFGYLQIDKIIYPSKEELPIWARAHPHATAYKRLNNNSNCIYIARKTCSFNNQLKGYGIFKYNKELDLTKEGMSRTKWQLPTIFKEVAITYHNQNSWQEDYFKSACRGQEFVVEENTEITKWAINLINKYGTKIENNINELVEI